LWHVLAVRDEEDEGGSEVDGRTLALSDGVFAIAMTLLVLAIHDPDPKPGQSLGDALLDHKGELVSWLWSFAVLISLWTRHRALLAKMTGLDGRLIRLNLWFLGGVAFVPYPTNVMAKFGGHPAAIALYAGTLALVSTLLSLMTLLARRRGYLPPGAKGPPWWAAPAIMLVTIPLSLLVGSAAFLLWFALPWVIRPLN
jgi:uncharacterized membrane protein